MIRLALAAAVCLMSSSLCDTRSVTVTVHVTSGGAPLSGIPICVRDGFKDTAGRTDSNGVAVIEKELSPRQQWIAVMPRSLSRQEGETAASWLARQDADVSLLGQYNFALSNRVDLVDGQSAYTVNIAATPARTITLRMVRNNQPIKIGRVCNHDGALAGEPDDNGIVHLAGVRKGSPSTLFVGDEDSVRITVPTGSSDVDIGDVVVPVRAETCEVLIRVRNWNKLTKVLVFLNDGLTLVSPDGATLISLPTFPSDESDTALTTTSGIPTKKIPAGTWYIAPGKFIGTPAQLRLSDRLAAGETPQGVPTIVAAPNQLVSLEIDAKTAEQAIMAP